MTDEERNLLKRLDAAIFTRENGRGTRVDQHDRMYRDLYQDVNTGRRGLVSTVDTMNDKLTSILTVVKFAAWALGAGVLTFAYNVLRGGA